MTLLRRSRSYARRANSFLAPRPRLRAGSQACGNNALLFPGGAVRPVVQMPVLTAPAPDRDVMVRPLSWQSTLGPPFALINVTPRLAGPCRKPRTFSPWNDRG